MNSLKATALFASALATLLEGALPLVDALRALSGEGFPVPVRRGAALALESIRRGSPFALALADLSGRDGAPFAFTRAQIALLGASSEIGRGAEILRDIARDVEGKLEARRAFASALAYPALVVAFTIALTAAIRFCVVPRLVSTGVTMGASTGVGVPDGASVARGMACALSFLAASGSAVFVAVNRVFARESPGYSVFYPLAFLTRNGVTVTESLALCETRELDERTCAAVRFASRRVAEGITFARAFAGTGRFDAFVPAWLEVADKNGDPASAFLRIAEHYREKDARSRELASRLMEPILIAITGIYVLILVETVILPVLIVAGGLNA